MPCLAGFVGLYRGRYKGERQSSHGKPEEMDDGFLDERASLAATVGGPSDHKISPI